MVTDIVNHSTLEAEKRERETDETERDRKACVFRHSVLNLHLS